jgi:hypothetical protein
MSFSSWLALANQWRLLATGGIALIVWVVFDEVAPNWPLRTKDVILLLSISYAATWVVTLIYNNGRPIFTKISNWIVLKISKWCEH